MALYIFCEIVPRIPRILRGPSNDTPSAPQAALQAEQAGYGAQVVVGAFLHDIGDTDSFMDDGGGKLSSVSFMCLLQVTLLVWSTSWRACTQRRGSPWAQVGTKLRLMR